jgi:hypothetical protein
MYVVTLNVVDSTGASSTAGPVQFTVTGQNSGSSSSYGGSSSSSSIDPSLAVMLAKIASPPPIVMMAADGGNVSIQLHAAGSSPGPGFVIDQYVWTVTNQQAGNSVVLSQQVVHQVSAAFVALPVGSYIVSLVVRDTSGRNASIAQVRHSFARSWRVCMLAGSWFEVECWHQVQPGVVVAASTQWERSNVHCVAGGAGHVRTQRQHRTGEAQLARRLKWGAVFSAIQQQTMCEGGSCC